MTDKPDLGQEGSAEEPRRSRPPGHVSRWRLLLRDRMATLAASVLAVVAAVAVVGPLFVGDLATSQNLSAANQPPFQFGNGWEYALGTDALGRSLLARLVAASQTTLLIAVPTVILSFSIGTLWGMWAGYHGGRRETVSMRVADVIMSFPSLLLAVVVLYVFSPSALNIIFVLALTRIPVYLRTARAESAELRSRLFVDAARTFGSKSRAVIVTHVFPIILPTLLTVATLDFCYVMLAESSLSFLGIGVQPPDVSWGLMVAQGREYLTTAWWLSVIPGAAIVVTTISATILSSWARIANDPSQRWRLILPRSSRRRMRPAKKG